MVRGEPSSVQMARYLRADFLPRTGRMHRCRMSHEAAGSIGQMHESDRKRERYLRTLRGVGSSGEPVFTMSTPTVSSTDTIAPLLCGNVVPPSAADDARIIAAPGKTGIKYEHRDATICAEAPKDHETSSGSPKNGDAGFLSCPPSARPGPPAPRRPNPRASVVHRRPAGSPVEGMAEAQARRECGGTAAPAPSRAAGAFGARAR